MSDLEKIYEGQLSEATPQNQTLLLRNYLRWKILDLILGNLKEFLDDAHNNPEKGLSVRAITDALNRHIQDVSIDEDMFQSLFEKAVIATRKLITAILSVESYSKLDSALSGSPRSMRFNLANFLQKVSKNAVANLMQAFEIQMRGKDDKFAGVGYGKSRGPGSQVSQSMQKVWQKQDFRSSQSQVFADAWTPERQTAVSYCAAEQIHQNPDKPFRMLDARRRKKQEGRV